MLDIPTACTLRMPASALETIDENARRFGFSTRTWFPFRAGTGFAKNAPDPQLLQEVSELVAALHLSRTNPEISGSDILRAFRDIRHTMEQLIREGGQ